MSSYAFGRTVALAHADAVARVTEELAKEGFGVLTEIDVQATLKKKLGKDMPPFRILGACNPSFAHQVIEIEPQIGALLPCNVVVRTGPQGETIVEAMDPAAVMQLTGQPTVHRVAGEVRERLQRVLAALG